MRKTFSIASVASLAVLLAAAPARAADIAVGALFNGKAVVMIDGKPRTMSAGETSPEGVRLISASSESAIVEFKGERRTLTPGLGARLAGGAGGSGQAVLIADSRGHFYANGSVNGAPLRFLIDTGATTVSMSADNARRLGINYLSGTRGYNMTANGPAPVYRVRLDNVRIGDITLSNVEASIHESGMRDVAYALLGMSFLNRTQMIRDGDKLTLVRRY